MPSLEFRRVLDRKSTRLNSSHTLISYAVFCLKKKNFSEQEVFRRTFPRAPDASPGAEDYRPSSCFFFLMMGRPPRSTLFPSTTLFRSRLNSSHTLISYAVFCLRDESVTGVQTRSEAHVCTPVTLSSRITSSACGNR